MFKKIEHNLHNSKNLAYKMLKRYERLQSYVNIEYLFFNSIDQFIHNFVFELLQLFEKKGVSRLPKSAWLLAPHFFP